MSGVRLLYGETVHQFLLDALADDNVLLKAFDKEFAEKNEATYRCLNVCTYEDAELIEWRCRLHARALPYVRRWSKQMDMFDAAWLYHHLLRFCAPATEARALLVRRILAFPADAERDARCRAVTTYYHVDDAEMQVIAAGVFEHYSEWADVRKEKPDALRKSAVFSQMQRFFRCMPVLQNREIPYFELRKELNRGQYRAAGWYDPLGAECPAEVLFYIARTQIEHEHKFELDELPQSLAYFFEMSTFASALHAAAGTHYLERLLAGATALNQQVPPLHAERRALSERRDELRWIVQSGRRHDFESIHDELCADSFDAGDELRAAVHRLDEIGDELNRLHNRYPPGRQTTSVEMQTLSQILHYPRFALFRFFFTLLPLCLPKEVLLRVAHYLLPLVTDCFRSRYALLEVYEDAKERRRRILSERAQI